MTAVLDKITNVQDQVVDVITQVQEPVTNGVHTVVEFITERVNNIPVLPFAEKLPTPKEVIDNQYKFAKTLLDGQKQFALSLAAAAAPLTDKALDRKAPVKRAAAKKSA